MNLKTFTTAAGLRTALSYLEKDPEVNIPRLMGLIEKVAPETVQFDVVKKVLRDKDNNWNRLLSSLYSDIDTEVRKTLFSNFIVNAF